MIYQILKQVKFQFKIIHRLAVTNTPTLNTFRIPGIQSTSGLIISSINNCTVNFNFHQIQIQNFIVTKQYSL